MGSESSKPTTTNNDYQNRLATQRALEQQRRIYEEKCEEFIRSQIAIQESIYRQNRSTTPKTSAIPPATASSSQTIRPASSNISNASAPSAPCPNVGVPPNNNNNIEENNTNRGAIPKNRLNINNATQPYMSTPNPGSSTSTASNVLYPNLQNMVNRNNNNSSQAHSNTSYQRPSISGHIYQTTPKTSAIPPATASTSQINPSTSTNFSNASAPPINVGVPPNNNTNNNEGNNTNRGAIPKNRRNQNAQRKAALKILCECVTCKGPFGLQIYQCENGHSSCKDCKFMSKTCGFCSKAILNMRNITLEATLADMSIEQDDNVDRIKCRNSKHGCSLSFTMNEMGDHLKECPFNDIKCPVSYLNGCCTWEGKINQLSSHFNDIHPHCVAEVTTEMCLVNLKIGQKHEYFSKIGSFNFLIHIKIDVTKNVMFMTTQFFGTKVSASKWTYELHVYNKREPQRKFTFIDVCFPYTESVDGIYNRGQCAVLPLNYAQTFVNNDVLNYKFFLKKKINNRKNGTSN